MMANLCGYIVLFGGYGDQQEYLNDMWTWNGTDWAQQSPLSSPLPRGQAVLETLNGTAMLFGGYPPPGIAPIVYQDTWTWDGGVWTPLEPTQYPPGRGGASAATLGGLTVVFGGDPVAATQFLTDTWSWDGMTWRQANVTTAQSPPGRAWATAATLENRVILFGGFDDQLVDLNDTWAFDGANWSQLTPQNSPTARDTAAMATIGDTIVLFGGTADGLQNFGDTWTWNGTDWSNPSVNGPPERSGSAMSAF
jgi:N-acetylneuraminic acid mutarotase